MDGEEFYRGKPQPDFATVVESLDAKVDTSLCFDRKIPLWKLAIDGRAGGGRA